MLPSDGVPEITDDELVAQFLFSKSRIRKNGTVKGAAFLPRSCRQADGSDRFELSLNRERGATGEEFWRIAAEIQQARKTPPNELQGCAKLLAKSVADEGLTLEADPISVGDSVHPNGNPNHANAVGWPDAKEDQKAVAEELALVAKFVVPPTGSPDRDS